MTNPSILIVEDDESVSDLCRTLLEAEGFHVEACTNGRDALSLLDSHPEINLILLDMLMPIMSGREFMVEFAKRPLTIVPIPIYLVSATASMHDGKEMGCFGFLKKPFSVDALLSIVKKHCTAS